MEGKEELSALAKRHIRPLLQLNDQLRTLAAAERDINVTSIVAVGDQSHGKTSVIEALSGVDLPRGEGIQTRVPLVLMLRSTDSDEHAVIKADGLEAKQLALGEIAAEVRRCTALLAGDTKDVVDKPLELTVYRRDQDDLTLIDLPGMTRVALNGQHEDIEDTITRMYQRYMEPSETVLLNVVSAMVDFTTSKSLQMSRRLDPRGERTLLCVTKADQHTDRGLLEKVLSAADNLRCPIFCVRNRSQPENDQCLSLAEVRARERAFFEAHCELHSLPDGYRGIAALSAQLVTLQAERIKETLPAVAAKIRQRVAEFEARLAALGPQINTEAEARAALLQCLQAGMQVLADELSGRSRTLAKGSQVVGTQVKMELNVDDVRRLHMEESGPIVGSVVDLCGIAWRLVVQGGLGSSVKVSVHAGLPDDVAQADCMVLFEAHGAVNSLAQAEVEHTFTATNAACDGGNMLNKRQTDGLAGVAFAATVIINNVVERQAVSHNSQLLCAAIHELDERFNTAVHGLYPNKYFFSQGFGQIVKREAAARQGSAGMPDAVSNEVSLAVIQQLQQALPPLLAAHVEQIHAVVHAACERLLVSQFESFPRSARLVRAAMDAVLEQQLRRAERQMSEILTWERTVDTKNHYFMDTVQDLRSLLLHPPKEDQDPANEALLGRYMFLERRLDVLRGVSNEEQRLVDLQIEIFAYWKTMKKRLVDYTVLATRTYLARQPLLEGQLATAVQVALEAAGDLASLVAPDAEQQRQFSSMQQRLAAMREALQLIKDAF